MQLTRNSKPRQCGKELDCSNTLTLPHTPWLDSFNFSSCNKLELSIVDRIAMLLVYFLKLCSLSWQHSVAPASPVLCMTRPAKEGISCTKMFGSARNKRFMLCDFPSDTICSHSPSASSSGSPLLGLVGSFLLRRCRSTLLVPWLQTQVASADPPPEK